MDKDKLWVIDCRTPDGMLDFTGFQPEDVFGVKAITGLTDWEMSRVIFARFPDAGLAGGEIPLWPKAFDKRWIARRKTW